MEMREIRYALAVLDAGSFTAAAKTLYVSRQAVSQSVKQLETELGFELFTPTARGQMTPTDEALPFFQAARPISDALTQLESSYGGTTRSPRHTAPVIVTIATGTGSALSLPKTFFEELRMRVPKASQSIEETSTDGALALLDEKVADIALVGSCPSRLTRYQAIAIVKPGLWLAVPPDSPLAAKTAIDIEDLDGQNIVTAGKLNHLHQHLVQCCRKAGVHISIPATSSNVDELVSMAKDNNALFFVFPPTANIKLIDNKTNADTPQNDIPQGTRYEWPIRQLMIEGAQEFGTYAVCRREPFSSSAAQDVWNVLTSVNKQE